MLPLRGHTATLLALCALCTTAGVGASAAQGAAHIGEAQATSRSEAEAPRASAGTPHGGPAGEAKQSTAVESTSTAAAGESTSTVVGLDGSGSSSHRDAGSPGQRGSSSESASAGLSGTSSATPTSASGQSAAAQSSSGTATSGAAATTAAASSSGPAAGSGKSTPSATGKGGGSKLSGLRGASSRATNPRSAKTGTGSGAHAVAGSPLLAGVTATAATTRAAAEASRKAPHTDSDAPVHPHKSQGIEPAIHTFERITGIVPESIWLMMAVLAALSTMLGIRSWLTSLGARRLERQRRMLAEEVGTLQAALLPSIPERLGPVRTTVAYRPAEGPAAGGDFYDVFALTDGRLAVIMGDVSGHGPTALPQTALLRYTLRTYLDSGIAPRTALHVAADMLDHQLEGSFATAALAVLDPATRTLTYACAGHPPPLVIGLHPLEPNLAGASPPIGAGLPTGMRQTVIALPGATQICFFTDGVVEARADGELLGLDRLERALSALGTEATAATLLERVVDATDSRPDDMAACVLQLDASSPEVAGRSGAPAFLCEEMELDRRELAGDRPERFLTGCGLTRERALEALDAARVVVGCDGSAVLRVHSAPTVHEGDLPEVEVVPGSARVMHMNDLRQRAGDLHPATS